MNYKLLPIIAVIITYLYIYYIRKTIFLTPVVSNLNNKTYYVRELPDKNEAANILATLDINLNKLINSLPNNQKNNRLKKYFKGNITENIPGSMHVAYSLNKGDELSICIRSKNNLFIDQNIIMFVAIHEISHIMTYETGHTENFWNNMKYLVENATELNIYKHVDYSTTPTEYCGITITSNP